ncbi:MAG TPA: hypothetical protein VJ779_15545 [Acetobacteraceae bacterium]|nr:hypothetical protein [Acetobacteraceae bacterium]
MSISAAAISHALHGLGHGTGTHPRGPVTFGQHLGAAVQQSGRQSAGPQATNGTGNGTGGLLSADMLRRMQTIR